MSTSNPAGVVAQERNQDATLYVGNLDSQVTEALLWELMLQAGPVVNVFIPKDRVSGDTQGYGFVEFKTEEDAEYALKIMSMIKLWGKPLRMNRASADKKMVDIGANLFIGNLDPEIDETVLHETFSAFGTLIKSPTIGYDPTTGASKGYAFVSYDSFESADAALEAMNGQYFGGRAISITYAYKKDSRGERHGSQAERMLAAQARRQQPTPTAPIVAPRSSNQTPTAASSLPAPHGYPAPPVGMPMGMPMMYPPPVYGGYPPHGGRPQAYFHGS